MQSGRNVAIFRSFLCLLFDIEDGGSKFLQNVDKLIPDYMVSHPGRQNTLHTRTHRLDNLKSDVETYISIPVQFQ
jgi:hypothetical protein